MKEMVSTYRNAARVIARLGNDTRLDAAHWKSQWEHTEVQVRCFNEVMCKSDATRLHVLDTCYPAPSRSERLPAAKADDMSDVCCGHIMKLLELTYWKRRWVVQEMRLAREIFCR